MTAMEASCRYQWSVPHIRHLNSFQIIQSKSLNHRFRSPSRFYYVGFQVMSTSAIQQQNCFYEGIPVRIGTSRKGCHFSNAHGHHRIPACHAVNDSEMKVEKSELKSEKWSETVGSDEISSNLTSDFAQKNLGRSGMTSFYYTGGTRVDTRKVNVETLRDNNIRPSSFWVLGPFALVFSIVLPPILLRAVFEFLLKDSLLTADFLTLLFTEILFYAGLVVFLVNANKVQELQGAIYGDWESHMSLTYKVFSVTALVLSIILPIGTFALVWQWTGPVAAAALVPYIAGVAVQYGMEKFVQERRSAVRALIPIVFQVYRLYQLNAANQLIVGLMYAVRGAEATAETIAYNGSLRTLLFVLQLLVVICVWSLATFLIHIFAFNPEIQQRKLSSAVQET